MAIIIDKEFQSLIPPLAEDEFQQLRENCIKEGIRDALVVWPQGNGDSILLDGHNRWQIIADHDGMRFKTVEKYFQNRDEAMRWVILNQFGRRNLSAYDRSILALKLKPMIAEKAKEKQAEAGGAVRQKSDKAVVDTKKELAKVAGVSHDTIHKVEVIEKKAAPEVRQQVRAGEKSIHQAYTEVMAKENKKLPSAKEYRKMVEERHEEFKEQKVPTIADVRQDKADKALLGNAVARDIMKATEGIGKIYVLITAKEIDVSLLSGGNKEMVATALKNTKRKIDAILQLIEA